jgi:hypothetical protein
MSVQKTNVQYLDVQYQWSRRLDHCDPISVIRVVAAAPNRKSNLLKRLNVKDFQANFLRNTSDWVAH